MGLYRDWILPRLVNTSMRQETLVPYRRRAIGNAKGRVLKYGLRGFDSIHLASFADVCRRAGTDDIRFSSFDTRVNHAAQKVTRALERSQK